MFVTFSDINKVGIHPTTMHHETPIGIYGYPLWLVWRDLLDKTIPFGADRKYVQLLRGKGNMLDLSTVSKQQANDACSILWEVFHNIQLMKTELASAPLHLLIDKWREKYIEEPGSRGASGHGNPYGCGLWTIIMLTSKHVSRSTGQKKNVVWNSIIRHTLGYDSVLDDGAGIIHANEPVQIVFLSRSGCDVIETFINDHTRYEPTDAD
jgi:hypothetical protein